MAITVEFFGLARVRAGAVSTRLPIDGPVSLRRLLETLVVQFPELARECFDDGQLRRGYVVNLDGDRFVIDPDTVIPDHSAVLIMSSDCGG